MCRFVAVTVHYMTNDFQCGSMLWDIAKPTAASLTADVIQDVVDASLTGALEDFKLVTIITDNGSNFAAAAKVKK